MSYAVPTQKFAVDLLCEGRDPRRGELFVSDPRRTLRALVDLLEGDTVFLPFLDGSERCITLINRDDLTMVTPLLVAIEREDAPASALVDRRQHARIQLRDGISLDGEVWFSPPAGRARLSDHLNEPTRFLQFHGGERLHFIRKSRIARVLELAAPARAAVVP